MSGTAVDSATSVPERPQYHGASDGAISTHYDVGNEFFFAWLDESLAYSCGLWLSEDDSLHTAQLNKLDYLIDEAQLPRPSPRVLDVGCGWGSLTSRVRRHFPEAAVTGLTLSAAQEEWLNRADSPGTVIRRENWSNFTDDTGYDAVFSVGSFEHFARPGLAVEGREAAYRQFFESCLSWLRPGGRLVLQTMVKGDNDRLSRKTAEEMRFICDEIFPDSELPWPSEIVRASERLLELRKVTTHADDYVKTMTAWAKRLTASRSEALRCSNEAVVQRYERYLNVMPQHFADRHLNLIRMTFVKR